MALKPSVRAIAATAADIVDFVDRKIARNESIPNGLEDSADSIRQIIEAQREAFKGLSNNHMGSEPRIKWNKDTRDAFLDGEPNSLLVTALRQLLPIQTSDPKAQSIIAGIQAIRLAEKQGSGGRDPGANYFNPLVGILELKATKSPVVTPIMPMSPIRGLSRTAVH